MNILNEICGLGFDVHYLVGNHDFMVKEYGSGKRSTDTPEASTTNPRNLKVGDTQLLVSGGKEYRFSICTLGRGKISIIARMASKVF